MSWRARLCSVSRTASRLEFAGLFALGIVLAIVAYRTKRLVPSYLTHAAFNATAFVMVIHLRSGH